MANADLLSIWNDALVSIGAKTSIAATTEQSAEAAACALRYRGIVEKFVRETDWNCLRTRAALEEPDTAAVWPPSWSYMYIYPEDAFCLRGFDIGGGYRPAFEVSYEVANDAQIGKVVLINVLDPTIVYTAYSLDLVNAPYEAKFDSSMREALGWALAAAIAGPLTGNAQIIEKAKNEAIRSLAEARVANSTESTMNRNMDDHQAQSLSVRGYCGEYDFCSEPRGPWTLPYWYRP